MSTHSQRGFTWIGFLALIATVVILGFAATPNLAATIKENRESTQIRTLLSSLELARRAAMQSRTDVSITVCDSGYIGPCGDKSWDTGWAVRYVTPPPGFARVIRSYPALTGGNRLSNTAGPRIVFKSNGMTDLSAAATFTLCDQRGAHEARALTLFISGVAQTSATPGQNVDGSALTCHF